MKRQQLLLLILAFGVFSILNTEMGIIGILPMAAEMYQVDIVQAGMLVSLFALGVAIAGPTMPLLCSRFNRKHVMLLVLGVFTICNALAVVASDFQLLLVLRVVPAFFHPVYCALAFSVAAASVAPEDAPDFSNGLFLTAANLGCMAGTMISGFFIRSLGLPFVVCGGLLLAAAALLLTKFVHCRADEQQATDCLIGS